MRRRGAMVAVVLALALAAGIAVGPALGGEPRWTPDGLFYQARALELGGADRADALAATFGGPLGADLRRVDPTRSGDPAWAAYHARFYERRVAVPAAAAALEPVAGDRALLDVSLAGYLTAVLALFALLSLRFRLVVAAGVTLLAALLPALTENASLPLTDSWGLALETAALACGIAALDRGRRWVIAWAAVILVLSFVRDSAWIPVLAAAWLALRTRSRVSWALLGSGAVALLPVLLLFSMPTRELLAAMLNGAQPDPGASWGSVAGRLPGALADLLQADGGYVRDGAWPTAAFLLAGLALLFAGRRPRAGARDPALTLLRAGALAGAASVVAVPIFSAFRLELALVPMAAFGLAMGAERALARVTLPQLAGAPLTAGRAAR